jgi:adenosylcobinamide kinase/adenosylcobinamide-phosphate guanylyltransferase
LGGARSGKSRYAESLIESALAAGPFLGATYLATAEALDAEMAARIEEHRRRRGDAWRTIEVPRDLVPALATHADPARPVLVDCLTLWLANVIGDGRDADTEAAALVASLRHVPGNFVLVANEVGLGIVPDNALAREFRDRAGRLNQLVAEVADRVLFVAAGLPLTLKDKDRDED